MTTFTDGTTATAAPSGIKLSVLRSTLDHAMLEHPSNYETAQKDDAIRWALEELIRRTHASEVFAEVPLAADSPSVDLTNVAGLSRFRPELLIAAWVGMRNRGAWAPSTAYEADDIVTSGGAMYRALADHASEAATEPPDADTWSSVPLNPRRELEPPIDYNEIIERISSAGPHERPRSIAFGYDGKAWLHPVPDKVYPLFFAWRAPLAEWDSSEAASADTEIQLPSEIARTAVRLGAAGDLARSDNADQASNRRLQEFEEFIKSVAGRTGRGRRVLISDRSARLFGGRQNFTRGQRRGY